MRYELIKVRTHYEMWCITTNEFIQSYDLNEYNEAMNDLQGLK